MSWSFFFLSLLTSLVNYIVALLAETQGNEHSYLASDCNGENFTLKIYGVWAQRDALIFPALVSCLIFCIFISVMINCRYEKGILISCSAILTEAQIKIDFISVVKLLFNFFENEKKNDIFPGNTEIFIYMKPF